MLRRKGEKSNRSYVACLPNLVDESLTFLYSSSALPRSNIFLKVGNFESSKHVRPRFHFSSNIARRFEIKDFQSSLSFSSLVTFRRIENRN